MNTEFCVGSLCHLRGSRPYHTNDYSTNHTFVALLTFGEGWHNNHHAFPKAANFGFDSGQFDLGFIVIRILKTAGLAGQISPTPTLPQREKKKAHVSA